MFLLYRTPNFYYNDPLPIFRTGRVSGQFLEREIMKSMFSRYATLFTINVSLILVQNSRSHQCQRTTLILHRLYLPTLGTQSQSMLHVTYFTDRSRDTMRLRH